MKFIIIILLISLAIGSYETKPTGRDVNPGSTTPFTQNTDTATEAVTIEVEIVKDSAISNTGSTEETVSPQTTSDNKSAENDELDLKLSDAGKAIADVVTERSSEDVEFTTVDVTSSTEASTVAVRDVYRRKPEKESDVGIKVDKIKFKPKVTRDTNSDDSDVSYAEARAPEKESDVGLRSADSIEDYEKIAADDEVSNEQDYKGDEEHEFSDDVSREDEGDVRRILGHKAQSGFEAASVESEDNHTGEDNMEVRSAQPIDSTRRLVAAPSSFSHPLTSVISPSLLQKPVDLLPLPDLIQHDQYLHTSNIPSIDQDMYRPHFLQELVQNIPKLRDIQDPKDNYRNSYPYAPRTPKPDRNVVNLMSSSNFDQLFFKLLEASKHPAGYRSPLQPSSYNFSVFTGLP